MLTPPLPLGRMRQATLGSAARTFRGPPAAGRLAERLASTLPGARRGGCAALPSAADSTSSSALRKRLTNSWSADQTMSRRSRWMTLRQPSVIVSAVRFTSSPPAQATYSWPLPSATPRGAGQTGRRATTARDGRSTLAIAPAPRSTTNSPCDDSSTRPGSSPGISGMVASRASVFRSARYSWSRSGSLANAVCPSRVTSKVPPLSGGGGVSATTTGPGNARPKPAPSDRRSPRRWTRPPPAAAAWPPGDVSGPNPLPPLVPIVVGHASASQQQDDPYPLRSLHHAPRLVEQPRRIMHPGDQRPGGRKMTASLAWRRRSRVRTLTGASGFARRVATPYMDVSKTLRYLAYDSLPK